MKLSFPFKIEKIPTKKIYIIYMGLLKDKKKILNQNLQIFY